MDLFADVNVNYVAREKGASESAGGEVLSELK